VFKTVQPKVEKRFGKAGSGGDSKEGAMIQDPDSKRGLPN
jgi:hypothetical protein